MTGKSDYFENIINDTMFRGEAFPDHNQDTGTGVYIALFTTMPSDDAGTGAVEVTGGSYARKVIDHGTSGGSWNDGDFGTASSGGVISNTVAIQFVTATALWGTVLGAGLYDAAAGGNLLYFESFTGGSIVINNGDTVRFAVGALQITEA